MVLDTQMGTKIRRFSFYFLIAAISVNFVLYSSQRYSPPRAEAKSYSVMHCPEHEGGDSLTKIVRLFIDSEEKSGSEKHCFCYSCCEDRVPPVLSEPYILTAILTYSTYTGEPYEPGLSWDLNKNLPIRAPPYLGS